MISTLEVDATLAAAYDRAAFQASLEIRRYLRPFNLKRHPLSVSNQGLHVGARLASELMHAHHPLVKALHDAGQFVDNLPTPVHDRLRYWL